MFGSLFKKPKVSTPASGFYSQPQGFQDLYTSVLKNANAGIGDINAQMFDPAQGQTAGAFQSLMQGFAPTAESLQSDIGMFMNPYNDAVINQINRQATGQNSLVNQAANRAGQMGSNRSFLATSDVEQNRLNNIGQFYQGQYDSAINNVLNKLVPQRAADAATALTVGQQSTQAPLQALMSQLGLLQGVPTSFGDGGQQAKSSGGGTDWGKVAETGLKIFSMSDRSLKQDIVHVGEENGHNIYEFSYKLDPSKRFIGVMADEVEKTDPEAVDIVDGYKAVDYDRIGVKFREA
jgi:hypothetical protein